MKLLLFNCLMLFYFTAIAREQSSVVLAQNFLGKMNDAAQKLRYSGVFVFQKNDHIVTSRITYDVKNGVELEKLEVLDGRPREYIRRDDHVTSYQPDSKLMRSEMRQAKDMFPSMLAVEGIDLSESYLFRLANRGRVAGVDCQIILVEPKDHLRFGYRFCAALPSGLMLQAQVHNAKHYILEQVAFTHLVIGTIDHRALTPTYLTRREWKVVSENEAVRSVSGWQVNGLPAGFKKIREVKQIINAPSAVVPIAGVSDLRPAVQLVFSDGLAAVSVFVERLNQQHHYVGILQRGATTVFGCQHGDFWITVVGEVPLAAIKLFAKSVEFKPK